jgi:hypothetical protein
MLMMIGPPDMGYDGFETLFQSIVLFMRIAMVISTSVRSGTPVEIELLQGSFHDSLDITLDLGLIWSYIQRVGPKHPLE